MAVKVCGVCEFQGPEFPPEAAAREIHRAFHGLARAFVGSLDVVVAVAAKGVKIKPLENLDRP